MKELKNLPIWRLKISNNFKSSSFKVSFVIFLISILLIISPFFYKKNIEIDIVFQNIGYNLFGAVFAFIAFQIVFQQLKNKEEEQGIQLSMLDKKEFIRNILNNRSQVEIMETWTNLLREREHKKDFVDALTKSIKESRMDCKILLLNPENRLYVQKREDQLKEYDPNIDVERNIYQNLLELQKIKENLGKNYQEKLNVKLYNIEPSLAIYKCQPNMILTFYKDKMSSEGGQLGDLVKYSTNSITGNFFTNRFLQIWNDESTIDISDVLYLKVSIKDEVREFDYVKYIELDDKIYIENTSLASAITNTQKKLVIREKVYNFRVFTRENLADDPKDIFENKYPKVGDIFFRLEENLE